jgi:hypothetical protein
LKKPDSYQSEELRGPLPIVAHVKKYRVLKRGKIVLGKVRRTLFETSLTFKSHQKESFFAEVIDVDNNILASGSRELPESIGEERQWS